MVTWKDLIEFCSFVLALADIDMPSSITRCTASSLISLLILDII